MLRVGLSLATLCRPSLRALGARFILLVPVLVVLASAHCHPVSGLRHNKGATPSPVLLWHSDGYLRDVNVPDSRMCSGEYGSSAKWRARFRAVASQRWCLAQVPVRRLVSMRPRSET